MFKKVLQTIAAAMTLCLTMHLAMASEIVKVPTAWLGEHEAFLMWYAKEKGWDAEAGLDIQMQLAFLEENISELENLIEETQKDIRARCRIYQSAGVIAGLVIVLILI